MNKKFIYKVMAMMLLTACDNDGSANMYFAYKRGTESYYIWLDDVYDTNHYYLDTAGKRLYCANGTVINLPNQLSTSSPAGTLTMEIRVEAICQLGQTNMDNLFQEIQPEQ